MRFALALGLGLIAFAAVGEAAPEAAPRASRIHPKPEVPPRAVPSRSLTDDVRSKMNENVVTIMAGSPSGTDLSTAYEIARVVDDGDDLRVLPIVGKGAAQSVKDVMFLRGVDMGITQANILKHFAQTDELGSNFIDQIVYVAKLFTEEVHIITRSNIMDVQQLNGQLVNLGEQGSGTDITGHLILSTLGVNAKELHLSDPEALEKLRSGEIAAIVVMAGKPAPAIEYVNGDGLKLLPIPYTKELEDSYYPATFTHEDYPELIPKDQTIDTVSVCTVLVAFNWGRDSLRYKKVAKFVDAFFRKFDAFQQPPQHPKWREVNFAATLEGWHRSPAAQAWINHAKETTRAMATSSFDSFLTEAAAKVSGLPASDAKRAELFREFLEWKKANANDQ